ncbi:hypothetical protein [Synechococcus sp. M16CYN]|uniref:hypothetical protein n=1 Tax=Synechococcus sp. M16CYN TaxID=3103139 RepID=UPI003244A470
MTLGVRADAKPNKNNEPGNLPAPYTSPWLEFGRDFQAIWVDLKLRFQELWRRNYEGDFSVPDFWPRGLAPTFWPLALLFSIAIPFVGIHWWQSAHPPTSVPEPLLTIRSLPESSNIPPAESMVDPEPAAAVVTLDDPVAPPLFEFDPLLNFFLDSPGLEDLLAVVTPRLAENCLVLQVTDMWFNLASSRHESLSNDWQLRAWDLGYDDLRLVDAENHLLARSARVGSGMVLFEIDPKQDAPHRWSTDRVLGASRGGVS